MQPDAPATRYVAIEFPVQYADNGKFTDVAADA
jgi:hypothetical protein